MTNSRNLKNPTFPSWHRSQSSVGWVTILLKLTSFTFCYFPKDVTRVLASAPFSSSAFGFICIFIQFLVKQLLTLFLRLLLRLLPSYSAFYSILLALFDAASISNFTYLQETKIYMICIYIDHQMSKFVMFIFLTLFTPS